MARPAATAKIPAEAVERMGRALPVGAGRA